MNDDDNAYRLEQMGLLRVDKVLTGFCVAIIPGFLALFAAISKVPNAAKPWALVAISANMPALFCLLWHSFRCPVRLKAMEDAATEACEALSRDMLHILETVAKPKTEAALFGAEGEKIIKGPDGKDYIEGPREKIIETMKDTMIGSLSPNNPIVANTIAAHSRKIYDAQRQALHGKLSERRGRFNQVVDYAARYLRYPLIATVLISATVCLIELFQ